MNPSLNISAIGLKSYYKATQYCPFEAHTHPGQQSLVL